MPLLSRDLKPVPKRPVKVLQIGSGNFARAFTAFAIQTLNKLDLGNVGIVIATSSPAKELGLNSQGGLYTVVEASSGRRQDVLIDAVQEQFSIPDNFSKFLGYAADLKINLITSNTTEAGILYHEEPCSPKAGTFPARLALWLKARHDALSSQGVDGEDLFILPCELIENNGALLRQYTLMHAERWGYSPAFLRWVDAKVKFMNTLVDRIVPGYPEKYIKKFQEEWGYEDCFAVLAETFFFLAVQGDTAALDKAYPFSKTPLDIVYTHDLEFYRLRKVSYLNGAHTALLGLSLLAGFETVQDSLKNPDALAFLNEYLAEACTALGGDAETQAFIGRVCARFSNPYLAHKWGDILLNALSKFAVRNIPVMLIQEKRGLSCDKGLKALAALIVLYFQGIQKDSLYPEFQKLSGLYSRSADFAFAFLSDVRFFSAEVPAPIWAPRLAVFIDALKEDPAGGFRL